MKQKKHTQSKPPRKILQLLLIITLIQQIKSFGVYSYLRGKIKIKKLEGPSTTELENNPLITTSNSSLYGTIAGKRTIDGIFWGDVYIVIDLTYKEENKKDFNNARKIRFEIWLPDSNQMKDLKFTANNTDVNLRPKSGLKIFEMDKNMGIYPINPTDLEFIESNLKIRVRVHSSKNGKSYYADILKFDLTFKTKEGVTYMAKIEDQEDFWTYLLLYALIGLSLNNVARVVPFGLLITNLNRIDESDMELLFFNYYGMISSHFFIWIGYLSVFGYNFWDGFFFAFLHNLIDLTKIVYFVLMCQIFFKTRIVFQVLKKNFYLNSVMTFIGVVYSIACFVNFEYTMYSPVYTLAATLVDILSVRWYDLRGKGDYKRYLFGLCWAILELVFLGFFSTNSYRSNYGKDGITYGYYVSYSFYTIFAYFLLIFLKIFFSKSEIHSDGKLEISGRKKMKYCPNFYVNLTNEEEEKREFIFIQRNVRYGGNYSLTRKHHDIYAFLNYSPPLRIWSFYDAQKFNLFRIRKKWKFNLNLLQKNFMLIEKIYDWKNRRIDNLIGYFGFSEKYLKIFDVRRRKVIYKECNKGEFRSKSGYVFGNWLMNSTQAKKVASFIKINKDQSMTAFFFDLTQTKKIQYSVLIYRYKNENFANVNSKINDELGAWTRVYSLKSFELEGRNNLCLNFEVSNSFGATSLLVKTKIQKEKDGSGKIGYFLEKVEGSQNFSFAVFQHNRAIKIFLYDDETVIGVTWDRVYFLDLEGNKVKKVFDFGKEFLSKKMSNEEFGNFEWDRNMGALKYAVLNDKFGETGIVRLSLDHDIRQKIKIRPSDGYIELESFQDKDSRYFT